jgi:hypothetical protein
MRVCVCVGRELVVLEVYGIATRTSIQPAAAASTALPI